MNEGAAADQAHARLQAILKAVVVGRDVADAASREAGESETLFQSAGAWYRPTTPRRSACWSSTRTRCARTSTPTR